MCAAVLCKLNFSSAFDINCILQKIDSCQNVIISYHTKSSKINTINVACLREEGKTILCDQGSLKVLHYTHTIVQENH